MKSRASTHARSRSRARARDRRVAAALYLIPSKRASSQPSSPVASDWTRSIIPARKNRQSSVSKLRGKMS